MVPNPYSIRTRSGSFLDFQNPQPDAIHLEDIAVALSRAPRFNGHTGPFYSVAQHAVFVARFIDRDRDQVSPVSKYGLHHDDSEAYLADVPTPAKRLMPEYYALEMKVMSAVATKFDLPQDFQTHGLVIEADRAMLFMERDQMIDDTVRWTNEDQHPGLKLLEVFPDWEPWSSEKAASIFYSEALMRN